MNKYSIIIPVRKINDFVKESITYLRILDYSNFEVFIVVDISENYEFNDSRFKILVAEQGKTSPGEKRNQAAAVASGNILVFLDDDAFPSKDWLSKANELFQDSSLYAVGGPAITPKGVELMEKVSGYILESWLSGGDTTYRHKQVPKRNISDYPTVNLFVTKKAFDQVGGFSTEFWPGEDTKLCLDLVKQFKKPFLYSPLPVVYHHRRKAFSPLLKQISRYGKHRGQFARIFPETSRLPLYFVPSLFLLGLIIGPIFCFNFPIFWPIYLLSIMLYIILIIEEGIKVFVKEKGVLVAILTGVGIFLANIVYGIYIIIGFIKKPTLKLKSFDLKTGNYIEG